MSLLTMLLDVHPLLMQYKAREQMIYQNRIILLLSGTDRKRRN